MTEPPPRDRAAAVGEGSGCIALVHDVLAGS